MLGVPAEMDAQTARLVAPHGRDVHAWAAPASAEHDANRGVARVHGLPPRPRRRSGGGGRATTSSALLIAARDRGQKLTEDELISSVILLLNAGHEATVHQTGNGYERSWRQGG